jgi:hypothetical protein
MMRDRFSLFGLTFVVALVGGGLATLVWNLLSGERTVDWGSAFRLALVLAFVITAVEGRKGV